MPPRIRHPHVALLSAMIVAALACLGTVPAAATTPTPFGVNLLVNPNAEDGSSGTGSQVVAIPGWKTKSNFTVVAYGTAGLPSETIGTQMFACGPNTAKATATQDIKITGRKALVDAKRVSIFFGTHIATLGADAYAGAGFGQTIPKGTRTLRVTLTGTRAEGTYCGVFFDGLELTLTSHPA